MTDSKRATAPRSLSKSEIVTIRLDPKLRYLAEIAARRQRRSLSSYIEWAIGESLDQVVLKAFEGYGDDSKISVADESERLWDVDESERFVKLAISYPELLTHDEQERWKMICDSGILGEARSRDRGGVVTWNIPMLEDKLFPVLRRRWNSLKVAHATGQAERDRWVSEAAPSSPAAAAKAKPAAGFEDMDDDIPF